MTCFHMQIKISKYSGKKSRYITFRDLHLLLGCPPPLLDQVQEGRQSSRLSVLLGRQCLLGLQVFGEGRAENPDGLRSSQDLVQHPIFGVSQPLGSSTHLNFSRGSCAFSDTRDPIYLKFSSWIKRWRITMKYFTWHSRWWGCRKQFQYRLQSRQHPLLQLQRQWTWRQCRCLVRLRWSGRSGSGLQTGWLAAGPVRASIWWWRLTLYSLHTQDLYSLCLNVYPS